MGPQRGVEEHVGAVQHVFDLQMSAPRAKPSLKLLHLFQVSIAEAARIGQEFPLGLEPFEEGRPRQWQCQLGRIPDVPDDQLVSAVKQLPKPQQYFVGIVEEIADENDQHGMREPLTQLEQYAAKRGLGRACPSDQLTNERFPLIRAILRLDETRNVFIEQRDADGILLL